MFRLTKPPYCHIANIVASYGSKNKTCSRLQKISIKNYVAILHWFIFKHQNQWCKNEEIRGRRSGAPSPSPLYISQRLHPKNCRNAINSRPKSKIVFGQKKKETNHKRCHCINNNNNNSNNNNTDDDNNIELHSIASLLGKMCTCVPRT